MGKRFGIIAAILVVTCLGVGGWQLLRPTEPEPVYQGRPLSYWLTGFGYAIHPGSNAVVVPTQSEARAALRQIGTNALPALLNLLRTPDSTWKDKFLAVAAKQHIIKIPAPIPSKNKQRAAMSAFSAIGRPASNALPRLIEIYGRPPNALAQQIVPIIIGNLGPSAKAAVSMLVRATAHTNDYVRMNSICALGQIHAEPESVVPALIKSLRDPYPDVRANAAAALAAYGINARQGVPALLDLLRVEQAKPVPADLRGHYTGSVGTTPPNLRISTNADVITPVTAALKAIDPEAAAQAGIK